MIIDTEKESVTVRCHICKKYTTEMRIYNGMLELMNQSWEFVIQNNGRTYIYCPTCIMKRMIDG